MSFELTDHYLYDASPKLFTYDVTDVYYNNKSANNKSYQLEGSHPLFGLCEAKTIANMLNNSSTYKLEEKDNYLIFTDTIYILK